MIPSISDSSSCSLESQLSVFRIMDLCFQVQLTVFSSFLCLFKGFQVHLEIWMCHSLSKNCLTAGSWLKSFFSIRSIGHCLLQLVVCFLIERFGWGWGLYGQGCPNLCLCHRPLLIPSFDFGKFFSWVGLVWGGLVGCVSKVESLARMCLAFQVYPAGKLQWHFTCGFGFRHGLWLPFATALAVLKGLSLIFIDGQYTNKMWAIHSGSATKIFASVDRGSIWSKTKEFLVKINVIFFECGLNQFLNYLLHLFLLDQQGQKS